MDVEEIIHRFPGCDFCGVNAKSSSYDFAGGSPKWNCPEKVRRRIRWNEQTKPSEETLATHSCPSAHSRLVSPQAPLLKGFAVQMIWPNFWEIRSRILRSDFTTMCLLILQSKWKELRFQFLLFPKFGQKNLLEKFWMQLQLVFVFTRRMFKNKARFVRFSFISRFVTDGSSLRFWLKSVELVQERCTIF